MADRTKPEIEGTFKPLTDNEEEANALTPLKANSEHEEPAKGNDNPRETDGLAPLKNGLDTEAQKEAPAKQDLHISFPSCRLVFVGIGFIGFIMVYALRVNLSVALVQMVNATYVKHVSQSKLSAVDKCESNDTMKTEEDPEKQTGSFNFDPQQQSVILSSFFYGYICLQIPAGTIAQKFGGKVVLLGGMFITSFLTVITPVIAKAGGYGGLVAIRAVEGLAQGVAYPSMHVLLAKWATPNERGRMSMFIYAGAKLGIIITNPLSGLLCDTLGWESVFYVFGGIGCAWCLAGVFLIYDNPSVHPRISADERQYIETALGGVQKPVLKVPWLSILTSLPVLALTFTAFVYQWGNFTLLTTLPQYFKYILNFDIKKNGLLSGLPYVFVWITMILTGFVCDALHSRKIMPVGYIRKSLTAVGFVGSGAFLLGVGYVACDNTLAVVLIVWSVAFSGVSWGGWSLNQLDLAPGYAGTLMGITNGFAGIGGIVGPVVVGALTKYDQSRAAWRKFFFISFGLYLLGSLVFIIFGSGERQKWSYPNSTEDKKKEEKKDEEKTTQPLTTKKEDQSTV